MAMCFRCCRIACAILRRSLTGWVQSCQMRAGELSGLRGKPQAGCVAFHAHDAQMFVAK